jgi:hypothetical protein
MELSRVELIELRSQILQLILDAALQQHVAPKA